MKAQEWLRSKLIVIEGHSVCGEPHYLAEDVEKALEIALLEGEMRGTKSVETFNHLKAKLARLLAE